MAIRIKLKGYDIVVLPEEGKVLGRLLKDGTRKEIFTHRCKKGYHEGNNKDYPEGRRSRLIWFAVNGPIPEGMQINHKNHDRADDRLSNLELVTAQQNNCYTRKRQSIKGKKTSTPYKGVHKRAYKSKILYRAQIQVDNKVTCLGQFSSPEEAALAYNNAALLHFGQYAIINHIGSAV